MFGIFTHFIEVDDRGFSPDVFLEVVFNNLVEGGCGGLEVAIGVQNLLAEGGEFVGGGLADFGEFGVGDGEGFGFGGDGGMLGLKLGRELGGFIVAIVTNSLVG